MVIATSTPVPSDWSSPIRGQRASTRCTPCGCVAVRRGRGAVGLGGHVPVAAVGPGAVVVGRRARGRCRSTLDLDRVRRRAGAGLGHATQAGGVGASPGGPRTGVLEPGAPDRHARVSGGHEGGTARRARTASGSPPAPAQTAHDGRDDEQDTARSLAYGGRSWTGHRRGRVRCKLDRGPRIPGNHWTDRHAFEQLTARRPTSYLKASTLPVLAVPLLRLRAQEVFVPAQLHSQKGRPSWPTG